MKLEIVDCGRLRLIPESNYDIYRCGVIFANIGCGTIQCTGSQFDGIILDADKVVSFLEDR
jgi:hypothetical protein